ncbi:unnamed protein product [Owenia fusiformis]|uniref:DUF3419 family protein n=1 Tax=Owenia fusiformis TaxID=6347 RepID=A0A8S4PZI9_OWEFU|nr:unnamed protein product [Owenia fusiformis]
MSKINSVMRIKPGDKVLTIAASGTHAISHLLADPQQVIALDLFPPQIYISKLQATAMKLLSRDEFSKFIGINRKAINPTERVKIYQDIRMALEPNTKEFWDKSLQDIKEGIFYCGEFNKLVATLSDELLPKVHNKAMIERYLALGDNMKEQVHFHDAIWDTEQWRIAYKSMRDLMIGPMRDLIEEIDITTACLHQYNRVIRNVPNNKNEFLEPLLTGDISGKYLMPLYLREGNYEYIKERLDRITWIEADIAEYIDSVDENESRKDCQMFDSINFSTVIPYMTKEPGKIKNMIKSAANICKPGSKLVYYTLGEFSVLYPDELIDSGVIRYDGQDNTYGIPFIPIVSTVIQNMANKTPTDKYHTLNQEKWPSFH